MLKRLTERIWYFPFEEERDRPNLGYIRGDKWSMAIDAGHSLAHTRAFYQELKENDLPLPDITVLTHWHWDHTFGMHAVNGICIANEKTSQYLKDFRTRIQQEGKEVFLNLDQSIRLEYAGDQDVVITDPDIVFSGSLLLNAGNCPIRLFQAEAPHTDDSTLIEVPGEGVLFIGDAAGGTFPTWIKNASLCRKLAETISTANARIVLEGHWIPETKEEAVRDLLEIQD